MAGIAVTLLPAAALSQVPSFELEVEAGPVWQTRNNTEIPNDGTATRFSVLSLIGTGPERAGRMYLTWRPSERHSVRLLAAPLSVTGLGQLAGPVDFVGARYDESGPVEGSYTFNSYRATYRWRFHRGQSSGAWLGFTVKIRDASIALVQGTTTSRKDDLGIVPLLHLAAERTLCAGWYVSFDADALAGGPGRAVDASLKLGYELDRRWSVRAGYRTVEGGADVESVYNFAWLHYAALSIVWRR